MRCLIILCFILAGGLVVHGQLPDFPLHDNGLLYDDTLMGQLRHLADSMRERVVGRAPVGDYFCLFKQTTARLVRLDRGNVDSAYADLREGISFEAFVHKYPQCETNDKILVLLDERQGYRVPGVATYYNCNTDDYSAQRIMLTTDEEYRPVSNAKHTYGYYPDKDGMSGNCVYSLNDEPHTYHGKGTNLRYVYAFYLDGVPTAAQLPRAATRLIAYRDRMVDSATGIYYKNARGTPLDFRNVDFGAAQQVFDNYVEQRADSFVGVYRRDHPYEHPNNPYRRSEDFLVKRRYTDSVARVDTCFKRLLALAIPEVEKNSYYPFIYLDRYMDTVAPRAALEIRRHWYPVAMDNLDHLTGRLSYVHIARLAAETGDWSVFIHAQLALAIDPEEYFPDSKFPVSGGTFLKELEVLNIDIDDILLADELASPWPDPGFSRVRGLGRALALEGGNRKKLEKTVLGLLTNKGLNDYQRLAMHYLFLNYVNYLLPGAARNKAFSRLQRADETLPNYLSARVRVQKGG